MVPLYSYLWNSIDPMPSPGIIDIVDISLHIDFEDEISNAINVFPDVLESLEWLDRDITNLSDGK